jgi:hypothetical protein
MRRPIRGYLSWAVACATVVSSVVSPIVLAQEPAAKSAAEGCAAFTVNLAREFAAMKTQATLVTASADPKVNPVRLKEGQHVTATLVPQESVKFAAAPARQRQAQSATAGLLFFKSGAAGHYRIALTSRHWIDVLDGGKAIDSLSHEGHGGCESFHKVVEFELPANRDLVIQLSDDDAATVDVLVTAVAKE